MRPCPDGKEEMKDKMKRIFMGICTLLITLTLTLGIGAAASAEDTEIPVEVADAEVEAVGGEAMDTASEPTDGAISESGKNAPNSEDNAPVGGENLPADTDKAPEDDANVDESGDINTNLFEEIYSLAELNADKIFSILAFIGTIVVSVGYKSGLLPLLRDALSKLKGAIDGVKADGESNKAMTDQRLTEISSALALMCGDIEHMKGQCNDTEQLIKDRETLRLILQGQIDMLYAIFMSSALPQYQKDEVGERINQMREEVKSYGAGAEN